MKRRHKNPVFGKSFKLPKETQERMVGMLAMMPFANLIGRFLMSGAKGKKAPKVKRRQR